MSRKPTLQDHAAYWEVAEVWRNTGWALMNRKMVANGDAWVGVTGKPISIDALKNFDPVRYGSLSMTNPLPLADTGTA
jgi:hypothetical protein